MSDEEILAELDEWLTNSLFTSSYRKIALQELIRRYNKLQDLIKKQQKEIYRLKTDKDILYGVINELKGGKND